MTLNKYAYAGANPVMYADPSGYMFTIIETQLRIAMENILRNMEQIHYTGMFCGFASAIDTALSGEGDVMTSFIQGYVTGVAGASILYGLMAFPSIMLEVKMLIGVFQSVGVGLGLYYMNEAWDDGNVPLAVYRTVMTTADIMTLYQEFGPQISNALGDSWNRFIHDNRGGIGLDGGNTSQGVGNPVVIEGRGSTGRITPNTLNEQMAMHQVQANPLDGAIDMSQLQKPVIMNDPRWPASEGWIKMSNNVNGVEIHFVYNKSTGSFDDFKFK